MTKMELKIWFWWITACGILGTVLFVFLLIMFVAFATS